MHLVSSDFMPHGYCYLWDPGMVWLHVLSDGLIALSYYSIPIALVYLVRRRRDLPFNWIFWMFTLFILGCGTTHMMEVWNVWHGWYLLAGILKAITAVASVTTAIMMLLLIPKAIALPSTARVAAINEELKMQIAEREQAELALQNANRELEQRVRERTADWKSAHDALGDSEERVRALLNSTAGAILGYDPEGNCTFSNSSALQLLGYKEPAELLGGKLHALLRHTRPDGTPDPPEDCPLHRVTQAGQMFHSDDLSYWRKDGTSFPVECWAHPVFGEGRVTGSVVTFFDITERKHAHHMLADQAEELARQAEELIHSREATAAQARTLQSVLDNINDGLIAVDAEGNFVLWNPAASRILGKPKQNIPPTEWSHHFNLYLSDKITPFPNDDVPLARAMRGQQASAEMFIRRDDSGAGAWIEASASPLRDEHDVIYGGVVAFRDVTQRKIADQEVRKFNDELEQRVRQRTAQLEAANQEMESFTYSVSHDLRAPLRHMAGFSGILLEEYGPSLDAQAQKYLHRIQDATARMGLLVDELLNLARVGRQSLNLQVTRLNPIVDEVVTMLDPDTKGRKVRWEIEKLPHVECDPTLIKQVFQNLLSNALKYSRNACRGCNRSGLEGNER